MLRQASNNCLPRLFCADCPDPTNNRWGMGSPGEDDVTLAIGRDYSDASPLRGVIRGGASHWREVGVTLVEVEAA